ncbi:MAG: serpin family protein [Bacteroidales bacterium]|nr:serpin family protein [Bacteroidales bacterium]MCF8403757.1 serpin family protein [Bacteroidales bacterium]
MKTKAPFLILILLCITLSACKKTNEPGPSDEPYKQKIFLNEKAAAIVKADNTFGIKLFKTLIANSEDEQENIILSPLSVSIALGMTLNGADTETKTAMENTLEFNGFVPQEINESYKSIIDGLTSVDPEVTLNIPNSIWYREDFYVQPNFISTNQSYFHAQTHPLDFSDPSAVNVINNWVAESTNQKIPTILNEISGDAVMFLINAIYFNGTWKFEFDEQHTQPGTFYLSDGSTKQVDMMKQKATMKYLQNNLFEAVDLTYGRGNFSMVIMLPKENLEPNDIINAMDENTWSEWLDSFYNVNVQLSLPKFKLGYEKRLNDDLIELGMGVAFSPSQADFSNINPDYQMFISFVKHKTFIDVNEEGTEAAAVTVVGIELTSAGGGETPYFLNVNKPFLFAIKERDTKSIIFIGKVMEPEYEEN